MATQFEIDIDAFVAKANRRINGFCIEFIQDLAEAIIRATPVDTGFLRGSWYGSIGAPIGVSAAAIADKAGVAVIASITLKASQILPGDIYYLMNGAKYALRVEYGFVGIDKLGRKYNQKPRSFVRGTLAQADAIAAATADRIASA